VPAVVSINETACKQPLTISECTTVSIELDSLAHDLGIKGNIVDTDTDTDTMHDTVDCHFVNSYECYRDFASLQFVDVCIDEPNVSIGSIKALEDSGTELCVIKSTIVETANLTQVGSVRIRGIVGDPVDAKLVKLHISLAGSSMQSIPIVCAVCPQLNENLILTVPVVKQLRNVFKTVDALQAAGRNNNVECIADVAVADSQQQQPPIVIEDDVQTRSADADVLRAEQLSDESLKPCWAMATRDKGGFFVKDGLLYHQEKVEIIDEKCVQLCLPASRRKCVLELAHNSNHESYRRTRDRIRLSFFWPCLFKAVKLYCRECETCQKMARVTVWDRVPINAVPRAQYAFQVFYADCAGPLFPNQKTNAFNYFFAMCDSATSFPFAYPLRALTAKNICDAMLKTFSITGIPEVVILDNPPCSGA